MSRASRTERVITVVVAAAIAAAGAWGAMTLEVETDITHFLPETDDPRIAAVMREMTGSELNRTITLTVEAPTIEVAATAAGELGERLARRDGVAWARSGPDPALDEAFYELYFPRRVAFISDRPETIAGTLSDAGLRERARELRSQLRAPTGTFVREIAPRDPWLLFPGHLARLRDAMAGALRVHDGHFVSADGRYGVVLLATDASPFHTSAQGALQRAIADDFATVDDAHGGALELEQAGVHRLALRSEHDVRDDVVRVSIAGTAGVLLFLVLIFGSLRYVVLGHVPIAAGVACALAASAIFFGQVHGLTLAFGATLIGVAVDYVAHYLNHHVLAPAVEGPEWTMQRIWPGLAIGGLTTIAGVAALAWTGYPAIREMALFTAVGVLAALLATRFLLPPWMPRHPAPTRLHFALARAVSRGFEAIGARRRVLWALPLAALAVVVAGSLRLETRDDVRALAAIPEDLVAEDQRVRDRVARVDVGRFVIAFGADAEEALQINDRVYRALEDARDDGLLGRQRSLHPLLWSQALQRQNLDAVDAAGDVAARTDRAYADEGFVEGAFAPFVDAVSADVQPLRLEHLEGSPLTHLVAPFVLHLDGNATATGDDEGLGDATGGVAILTFLHDVRDEDALAERIARVGGTVWWDQQAYMADAYRAFRERTFELVAVGLVFVLLVVGFRYRSLRSTAAAVLPAVLAGATSLAIVALTGEPLTLVHVVTLILVLSMGVDYGVFMVESASHEEGPAPTLMSLVVACASTVLSFGALAFSAHPAMRAIGITTAIGIALSLLLAPAASLLLRRDA